MPWLRDEASGKAVWQDPASGLVQLKQGNHIREFKPEDTADALLMGGFEVALPEEVQQHDVATKQTSTGDKIKTGLESAARTAISTATAPIWAPIAAASSALGQPDPTEPIRGEGVVKNLMGIYGHATGEEMLQYEREYEQEARQRATENTGSALLGGIGGSLIGAGPLSGAVRGAVARGAVREATGFGVAEGSIVGAGQAAEDSFIRDVPLTAEQIVASAGIGGLLGGGAAAGGAVFNKVLRGTARASLADELADVAEGGVRELTPAQQQAAAKRAALGLPEEADVGFLRDFADSQLLKALGAKKSDLAKLGRTAETIELNQRKLARDLLDAELKDGTRVFSWRNRDELLNNLERAIGEADDKILRLRKDADEMITRSPALQKEVVATMDDFYRGVEREVIQPLKDAGQYSKAAAEKSFQMMDELNNLRDALGSAPSLQRMENARAALARFEVYPEARVAGSLPGTAPPNAVHMQQIERMLADRITKLSDRAVDAMPETWAGHSQYMRAMSQKNSFVTAKTLALGKHLSERAAHTTPLGDYLMAGAAVSFNAPQLVQATVTKVAVDWTRRNANHAIALIADKLARRYDRSVSTAISHAVHAKPGSSLPSRVARGYNVGVEFAASRESNRRAFERRAKEVISWSNNGGVVRNAERSTRELTQGAPKTAGTATMTAIRGAQFLASKIPQDAITLNPMTGKTELNATDEEIAEFKMFWETVNQPMTALRDLARGMLTPQQVEALEAVYPALFADMQQKALEELSKLKDPPPYDRRAQMDFLLKLNGLGEKSLSSNFQAALEAARMLLEQETQEKAPRRPIGSAGKLTAQYQSLSQQIESTLG